MKPPPFSYYDPASVSEAVDLLSRHENAKLLAGGQSLMPMLNMRFVLPDHLIDINKIDGLAGITEAGDTLRIGAMTRQREIEYSELVAKRCPLMREAVLNVGHRQTRNRGTIGGSLSHLDPSAELVAVAAALDATLSVTGPNGDREVPFSDWPVAYMTPAMELDEILTGVTFPLWPEGHGYAFTEFARRHGDFAIVSAAALLEVGGDGVITRASVTVSGVGAAPVRIKAAESGLTGAKAGDEAFRAAAEEFRGIDAMEDVHASSKYRQHLAAVLSRRALEQAHARATG
ncbi:MAG: FAD binding domain-containing protein [Alphaproteobacteria bacterium]